MNNQLQTIETLALVSNPDQAKQVAGALREAGIPTHQYWVEDSYSFAENLARCSWDLVIIAIDDDEQHIPACILRYPDTPFLAITQKNKSNLVDGLLEFGITDVASFSRPARLTHTLNRALADASIRFEHRRLRQNKDDQDSLLRNLLHASDEPIAFLHQGLHSFANPAYLVTMGLADADAATSTPILDLVATRDRPAMKKILQDFSESRLFQERLPTRLVRPSGATISVVLDMSAARFDGENVVQIIARMQKNKAAVTATTEQTAANEQTNLDTDDELPQPTLPDRSLPVASLKATTKPTIATAATVSRERNKSSHTSWASLDSISDTAVGIPATDLAPVDKEWMKKIAAVLGSTDLKISIRTINSMRVDMYERFQLNLTTLPGRTSPDNHNSVRSVEKLVAEARRHNLLPGLDRWALYNAASQLAKQLRHRPGTRFYINLYSDQHAIDGMTGWLKQVIGKFRLPPGSLNVMLDGGGLTDNTKLSNALVVKLKNMNVGVGICGLNSEHLNAGALDDSISVTSANARELTQELARELANQQTPGQIYNEDSDEDLTVGFELLEALPVDFALLDSAFSDQIADNTARDSLQRLLQRCQDASITTMIEASGPGALSAVWKMGVDCFIGEPGLAGAEPSPAELDLTAAI